MKRVTSFRRIQSEVPFRMVRATQSKPFGPVRFSRRLRNLSPEPWNFLSDTRKMLSRKQSKRIIECCVPIMKIKNEVTQAAERKYKIRRQHVLDIINKGSRRELEKLSSVGSKTAQRIVLFRNLKGPIIRISQLADMPNFPKRLYENFLAQNFLKQTN
ncbi:unnamed protein product [Ceutorhynchus assimilis]|uniref:Uncharacterized protein n=1 Tax=Ceutorhynchus assimilis TaxID=467358 RepID=A0A9N9QKP9_9CUCU|nr:unnamed protein product [Ceutorhynchus assimilis]